MDIAQSIQRPLLVIRRESRAVVALLPKMPRPVQHLLKTHGSVTIQPVHNLRQILWRSGFQKIVNMMAHNA